MSFFSVEDDEEAQNVLKMLQLTQCFARSGCSAPLIVVCASVAPLTEQRGCYERVSVVSVGTCSLSPFCSCPFLLQ